jgi:hypothetical protein
MGEHKLSESDADSRAELSPEQYAISFYLLPFGEKVARRAG